MIESYDTCLLDPPALKMKLITKQDQTIWTLVDRAFFKLRCGFFLRKNAYARH